MGNSNCRWGKQIAFRKETGLHIVDVDKKKVYSVTELGIPQMWHPFQPEILLILSGDVGNHPDNIAAVDINNGQIAQLTDTQECEFNPQWSPDGQKIAFVSQKNGNLNIYTMDADGSNVINLTNTAPQHESSFSWSPDGNQIVYTHFHAFDIEKFSQEIYVMNADGSETKPLTDTPDEHEFGPIWSPDGQKIAFWSTWRTGQSPYSNWWTLNVMNTDGSDRRVLATFGPTTLESDDSYPSP